MTVSCFRYSASPEHITYLHAGEEEGKKSCSGLSISKGSWSKAIPGLEEVPLVAVTILGRVLDLKMVCWTVAPSKPCFCMVTGAQLV